MKGRVSISRVSSNMSEDFMAIDIEDSSSGLTIVRTEMSLENFAKVITGQGNMECELRRMPSAYTTERYGMKAETKTVLLDNISRYHDKEILKDKIKEAVGPHLVDGWELWQDGTGSRQDGEKWKAILLRYV